MEATRIEALKAKGASFEEELEDRYENYAIISRLFREEIDKELLADLCGSPAVEPVGQPDFDEGYARLRAHLDGIEDLSKGKSELAIDYVNIFLGYGIDPNSKDEDDKMRAAYPYESVYTSGSKTLTSGLAEGVTLNYRAYGFKPSKPRILADDHIACEFEYLQYLVGCEIAYLRDGEYEEIPALRDEELAFIEAHPRIWIDKFSAAIGQRAETSFYPALAQMAKGWLAMDEAYLKGDSHE